MKARPIIHTIVTLGVGLTPYIAQAAIGDSVQRCVDEFASQNFPDSRVTAIVESSNRGVPLIAQSGTQTVQLVASSKESGRVLAKTTCQVRYNSDPEGQVIVMPLGPNDRVN